MVSLGKCYEFHKGTLWTQISLHSPPEERGKWPCDSRAVVGFSVVILHLLFRTSTAEHKIYLMQVQQNNIISWHRSRACPLRSCCSTSHHKGYLVNNGNRTEWNPIFSVIIRVINKIGRPRSGSPICKSQVLPVYHNCYNFGKKHWNTFRTYISGRNNV